jgi:hypothetical protein
MNPQGHFYRLLPIPTSECHASFDDGKAGSENESASYNSALIFRDKLKITKCIMLLYRKENHDHYKYCK